jgi:hypothetical protein
LRQFLNRSERVLVANWASPTGADTSDQSSRLVEESPRWPIGAGGGRRSSSETP